MPRFIREGSLAAPIRRGQGGRGRRWRRRPSWELPGVRAPSPPPCARSAQHARCPEPRARRARQLIPRPSRASRPQSDSRTPAALDFSQVPSSSERRDQRGHRRAAQSPSEGRLPRRFLWPRSRPRGTRWGAWGEGLHIRLLLQVPRGFRCRLTLENTALSLLLCFTETERKFPGHKSLSPRE